MDLQVKRFEPMEMKKIYFSLIAILLTVSLWAQSAENAASFVSDISIVDTNRNNELDSIVEVDPVFDASVASGISAEDTKSWNNKLDSFTETDPIFDSSIASAISANDTVNWNNKQDRLTAGMGLEITNNTIRANNEFYLEQDTLGGIVFYIYFGSDQKQHGLIVSKIEGASLEWQNTCSTISATRTWDGAYNTNLMIDSPAKEWVNNNFPSDWYLPSIDELSLLWNNRFHVNRALNKTKATLLSNVAGYWSSTEGNETHSLTMSLDYGIAYLGKTNTYNVRAVRSF